MVISLGRPRRPPRLGAVALRCSRSRQPTATHLVPLASIIEPDHTFPLATPLLAGEEYYESHAWQYILLVVYNMSYTSALYGLLLFYMAAKPLLAGERRGVGVGVGGVRARLWPPLTAFTHGDAERE